MRTSCRTAALLAALCLAAPAARGADEAADRALVHASQSPASNLVNVALRNEIGLGVYHKERTANLTWLEPSFPTSILGGDWILAHAIRLPLIWQPVVVARTGGTYGVGALRYEMLLARAAPGALGWGLGFGLQFPTDSDYTIGDHKWAAGPAGALSWGRGPVHAVLAATQLWTYASAGGYPVVNRLTLKPALIVDLPAGFFLLSAPVIAADWKRPAADRWTIPVGAGLGRIFAPGGTRLTLTLQGYWTAAGPTEAWTTQHPYTSPPDWTIRAGVALLFPR
jgi:hypothetical protein